jgi:hypothetical protein
MKAWQTSHETLDLVALVTVQTRVCRHLQHVCVATTKRSLRQAQAESDAFLLLEDVLNQAATTNREGDTRVNDDDDSQNEHLKGLSL